jgi:hypothetical protein
MLPSPRRKRSGRAVGTSGRTPPTRPRALRDPAAARLPPPYLGEGCGDDLVSIVSMGIDSREGRRLAPTSRVGFGTYSGIPTTPASSVAAVACQAETRLPSGRWGLRGRAGPRQRSPSPPVERGETACPRTLVGPSVTGCCARTVGSYTRPQRPRPTGSASGLRPRPGTPGRAVRHQGLGTRGSRHQGATTSAWGVGGWDVDLPP